MVQFGRNIVITVDGTAVAAARSCKISHSCDVKRTLTPQTGQWPTLRAGRKSWQITCDTLMLNGGGQGVIQVKKTVTLAIKENGTTVITAKGICQRFYVTATQGNLAHGSFVFVGKGTLL